MSGRPARDRFTEIIATLGPASADEGVLAELLEEGTDWVRLNFSHGTPESHRRTAATFRRTAVRLGKEVRLLCDLQGPKLRIGDLPNPLELREGDGVFLSSEEREGAIRIVEPLVVEALAPGDHVFIDDGAIELEVQAVEGSSLRRARVLVGGRLDSRSGITVPGKELPLPALSEKDLRDIELALELGADAIAQSMVRSAADVRELRSRVRDRVRVVAKIETAAALGEIEAIVRESDALMVARGDLGVSIPRAEVPLRQKEILDLCRLLGRTGIVATEMLLSMVTHTRPTRAEVSDVATAVLDGAHCVMLSEETAIGAHPPLAVKEMREIIAVVENSHWYRWD